MKCCVINSKDLSKFDIWSAEFYNNTNEKHRTEVLKLTGSKLDGQITILKLVMSDMFGYKQALMRVKTEMGLGGTAFKYKTTAAINRFKPVAQLLVLKTVANELKKYQTKKLKEMIVMRNRLLQEKNCLRELCKTSESRNIIGDDNENT